MNTDQGRDTDTPAERDRMAIYEIVDKHLLTLSVERDLLDLVESIRANIGNAGDAT